MSQANTCLAIRQMLRVLRPGGLIAVRDVDWGSVADWPSDPWIDRFTQVAALARKARSAP